MKNVCTFMLLTIILSGFMPSKPKVLIIGDSISIGYFPYVQKELADIAMVTHNKGNAQHTGTGLEKIQEWLGNENWDIIQFNWGLWDLIYHTSDTGSHKHQNKIDGKVTYTPEVYARNLDSLVKILKKTHAKLIFVTTTYVPENEPNRFAGDAVKYNQVALKVMKANGVSVNDIYAVSKKVHEKFGLADNNVHYTNEGYKRLAKYISDFLKEKL